MSAFPKTISDIGSDDVSVAGGSVHVVVHSLGRLGAPGGQLQIVDAAGRVRANVPIPPLEAPDDLWPRTTTLSLPVPDGAATGWTVRVALPGDAPEVTRMNNSVAWPAAEAGTDHRP